MSVTALPLDSIGVAMGRDVSSFISSGMVVMGETSASLTGAQAGDVLELIAADGSTVALTVGRVAPDAEVGGTEIVMSTAQADLLGATLPTSVLIYGQFDRDPARRRVGRPWAQHRPEDPRAPIMGSVRPR